jgi:AraC family transcriptional regulator of adaptative response / methylphosphotriester-DNA alkyltransferase methyltransferase
VAARHLLPLFAQRLIQGVAARRNGTDDIARRVASSRRQLQRAYSEVGQTTFREHLTRVRMNRAAAMLTTRGMTVREVAYRVGYRQPAQFAKAFRRHHQTSPSEYRSSRRLAAAGPPAEHPSLRAAPAGLPTEGYAAA